jgi:teichuronic acid biosynthesis glycosyltransferase TuaC
MREYFRMLRPLNRVAQELRPYLVHVFYGGVMAWRVTGWNARLPKVVTFHGSDLLGENFSGQMRKWISRVGICCSRRAARRADGVVLVASRLRQALPGGLDDRKLRVIPCGIDLERFRGLDQAECRRKLGWASAGFHVLFASNNGDPVKRPELAQAAVKRLNAGGSQAELHLLQGVRYADVPEWMNAADVLLLTSAHEGSPTVVKEALACGLPVVSVDVGDVAERIQGLAGCHLAEPEPEALASRLRDVQRFGRRVLPGPRVQDFDARTIARRLDRFYREVLRLPLAFENAPVGVPPASVSC